MVQDSSGIWKYKDKLEEIRPEFRISLNEGNTKLVDHDGVFFKLEYQNPSGSVKDRGMAYQISKLKENGIKRAVISSSGNAAISAGLYCQKAGIDLKVFVSSKINRRKLTEIKKQGVEINFTSRPVKDSFIYAKKNQVYNLRPSKDQFGHIGYQTIAFEIFEAKKDIDAVFIPVSSGTTLLGIAQGFEKCRVRPAIHAVQTEYVHTIAQNYDQDYRVSKSSIADGIVARFVPQEIRIKDVIDRTKGFGWVISDDSMKEFHKVLIKYSLVCSYEGAACLAALHKARKNNHIYKNPVCLLTGKYYG